MNNIIRIQAMLRDRKEEALLLTSPVGRLFATGFASSAGAAVVTRSDAWFFTDFRYFEAASAAVRGVHLEMSRPDLGLPALVRGVLEREKISRLGFEEGQMTVAEYALWSEALPAALVPMQGALDGLRSAKQPYEVEIIRRAQAVTEAAFSAMLLALKPGMTEREAAALLTYELLRCGAQEMAFEPIVVAGPNSSLPHGVPGERKIQAGDFLTMDFGAKVDGYCSDMTRTVAFGRVTEEMGNVYSLVLRAQQAGILAAKAGIPGRAVDEAGRRVIREAGYGEYFGHGFGHGVGIQIHEDPRASVTEERLLPAGEVLTAEPGVYLPGKFGVRIEDMLLLREDGCENLTHSPKELLIL